MNAKVLLLTAITLLMQLVYAQVHISTDTIGKFSKNENLYVKSTSSDSLASGFVIVIKKEVKLHKHLYHSEHVFVIEGEGQMQLGDKTFTIKPNDLIFIPKNTPHKVITTSKKPLKVLSIQSPNFNGKDRVMLE
jgi:mannose-6-phosphate isomerase-like protein (cupin superfamily)